MHKLCPGCGEVKPGTEFYKHNTSKDGLFPKCKACEIAKSKAWAARNAEVVREKAKRRWHEQVKPAMAADPALKKKKLAGQRKYKQRLGKDGRRNAILREKYGITLAQYREMAERQNGQCAICGKTPRKELVVDHCHKTGRVRGLLCHGCNRSIGMLGDNASGVMRAVEYLREPCDGFQPFTFIA